MSQFDFSKLDLMDALDLAILIEEEAQERYVEFSKLIGNRYEGDAGDFFTAMAKNEGKHGEQLLERRKKMFGDKPRKVNRDMIWEIEAPGTGEARTYMGPFQAMELAYACEEKAYCFFVEALRHVTDPEVVELFTELKDEEVEHQNLLRGWMDRHYEDKDADRTADDIDEPPAL